MFIERRGGEEKERGAGDAYLPQGSDIKRERSGTAVLQHDTAAA